jgi:hypothetical protein
VTGLKAVVRVEKCNSHHHRGHCEHAERYDDDRPGLIYSPELERF